MAVEHGVNFIEVLADGLGIKQHEPVISAIFASAILVVLGFIAAASLRRARNPLIPDQSLTLRNFFELLLGFLVGIADTALGRENRKYLPFVCTVFFYIFFMNLLGLIPGFSMPTDDIPINIGIALTVFVLYHAWGIKEVGLGNYLKHFAGPVIYLAPFIFALELFSHSVRPLTLTLRLFGNMTADHTILAVFTDLTKVGIPVIFYGMGTFVSFVQAFVFTVLAMVYINLAVTHEDHGAHEAGHH
jgi:F-type H+-transporting ATPase subunit a